jgi:hypothetical protein
MTPAWAQRQEASLNFSDFGVDCSWAVWVCLRLNDAPCFHAIRSKTASQCTAPEPVSMRDKLREIGPPGAFGLKFTVSSN